MFASLYDQFTFHQVNLQLADLEDTEHVSPAKVDIYVVTGKTCFVSRTLYAALICASRKRAARDDVQRERFCFELVFRESLFERGCIERVLGRGAIRDRGNTERVEDKERAVCVLVSHFCRERSFRKSEEAVSREREAGGERVRFQRKRLCKEKGKSFQERERWFKRDTEVISRGPF